MTGSAISGTSCPAYRCAHAATGCLKFESKKSRSAQARLLTMRSGFSLPQQVFKIEPVREHRKRAIRLARPLFLWPVPIELDAVLVGVAQIQRLADAVIAGAIELNAGADHAMQGIGQCRPRRIENCGVKQARRSRWRRMAAFAFPGIEPDMMMIAAGRDERRAGA